MKVSIITVAFNAAATIEGTCASVAAQDWADIEHIIIDGGSTDDTAAVVAASARPGHVFVSEPDKGLYDAMNKGLARATGDLIGFLNADDFFARSDAARLLAVAAAANPAAAAIAAGVAIVAAGDTAKLRRAYPPAPFARWMLRFGHMPPHPGFYARAAAFARVGAFDPAMEICADFDWMVRFFYPHHLSAVPLPATIVTMRDGGVSARGWAARRTLNGEMVAALRRHGVASASPVVWSKYLAKAAQLAVRPADWPAPEPVRWPHAPAAGEARR